MASYVYSFTVASSDLTTFKEIPLEPSLGNYAQTNSGHQAIDISVVSSNTGAAHTLQLVWADATSSALQVLGVTKVDAVTATPGSRTAHVDGSTTSLGYVCVVSAASSSSSLVKTVGVGACADLRSTSVSIPSRKLYIGATSLAGGGTITVIVTPTKII